jgi:hypothetical protein
MGPNEQGKTMKLSRRNLLQMFAATAASSVAARYASAAWPDPLAIWEPASQAGSYTPRKVLEIFLRGGASQWGAFWYDPILGGSRTGSPAGTGDDDISTTDWGNLITGGGAPTVHNWESRQIGRAAGPMFRLKNNGAGTPNRKLADYMRVLYVATISSRTRPRSLMPPPAPPLAGLTRRGSARPSGGGTTP